MPNDSMTRWTVTVSKETDIALRSFLAHRGMKRGDMSKFIEEAVRWRMFDQTVNEVQGRFSDLQPNDLQALIDEATQSVRDERFRNTASKSV